MFSLPEYFILYKYILRMYKKTTKVFLTNKVSLHAHIFVQDLG